jgi:hypothetical protein
VLRNSIASSMGRRDHGRRSTPVTVLQFSDNGFAAALALAVGLDGGARRAFHLG